MQASDTPLLAPLSRLLFPFAQRSLFRTISVSGYDDLTTFCDYVGGRTELGSYIRELCAQIEFDTSETDVRRAPRESLDPLSPSNETLRQVFENLVQVRKLMLGGSTRITCLVLETRVATSSFPNLRHLALVSTFDSFTDPFHPAWYQNLQYYAELVRFHLQIECAPESVRPFAKPSIIPRPMRTKVLELVLKGPLSKSQARVLYLLDSFGPLSSLALCDTSTTPRLYDILTRSRAAKSLLHLDIDCFRTDATPEQADFDKTLSRLKNLESLAFGGFGLNLPSALYSSLRSISNLEHLSFHDGIQVSLDELTKLVTGAGKIRALKEIRFDNIVGKVGTLIADAGPYEDDSDHEDASPVHPDWILPEWTPELSEVGLVEFSKKAKEEGVEVSGTVVDAIGVLEELDRELEQIRAE